MSLFLPWSGKKIWSGPWTKCPGGFRLNVFLQYSGCNVRCLYRQCGKLGLSMTSISRVFVLGKSHPPRAFPLLEDSEFFLLLSLRVILRSCIASLKVLNYNLEDHQKKVYYCVCFIQIIIIPMVWADFAHSRCPWSIRVQTHQIAFFSSQIYFSTNSSISCLKFGCRKVNFSL